MPCSDSHKPIYAMPFATIAQRALSLGPCLCLCALGCGGGELATVPVEAKVTLDGQPVTKGVVFFTPERGRQARGEIQADGSVDLGTYGTSDGVIVGKSRIAVVATEDDPSRPSDGRLKAVRWLVPERYGAADTSGLTLDVDETGGYEIKIELSTDGPGRVVESTD